MPAEGRQHQGFQTRAALPGDSRGTLVYLGMVTAVAASAGAQRAEGLDPLHVFRKAETAKWVRSGIDMERLEQVLLAVGLSLRDLCTAQFTNDPDERPADISAYIFDSKLPFAEY